MVEHQLCRRGIGDSRVLAAFRDIPRHLFVSPENRQSSYEDSPLPIGQSQTISQPYMVALMTQELNLLGGEKVLEIGTGSGYQTAILAHLGAQVYSVERISSLAAEAKEVIDSLGYKVDIKVEDGSLGWQEQAPYDRIIVTAASPCICPPWQEQLKIGGMIVLPLGVGFSQNLVVAEKVSHDRLEQKTICGCIFVPLIGRYGHNG